MGKTLTKLSQTLILGYDKDFFQGHGKTISVNPVVAELATWYEKFRTAMDYREDEVILRAAIERILKRRLLLSGSGETIAPPLIRELVWARYFPDASVPEALVAKAAHAIDLYLRLEGEVNRKHKINRTKVEDWILHFLSSEIEQILKPNDQKNLMCNFIYHLFTNRVAITDDTDEVRDVQVFIGVRLSFANDDLPFLHYHLFKQYFGQLTTHNLEKVSDNFLIGIKEIEGHLKYPLKEKIYGYIKNQVVPFLILDDVLRKNRGQIQNITHDEDHLNRAILEACSDRYRGTSGKVRRAILRSIIFIFITKAILALAFEGTFESLFYGKIILSSMAFNILSPVILMIIVGLFIKTPTKENSFRILKKIDSILFDELPQLDTPLVIKKQPSKTDPLLDSLFIVLWLVTFALSFGAIIFILSKLKLNPISQGIFVFFLAIVSFVSYRINQTAHMYILKDRKESLTTLAFDFFFMPFIQVGRKLTQGIAQLNIILFIFDFIIETPFKGVFAFFEQWFLFLRTQREKLE